jgi:hypothetical protein
MDINCQVYGIVARGCAMSYLYVGYNILPLLFNFLDELYNCAVLKDNSAP